MGEIRRPIAVMGVSGAGKTTVGVRLAAALGVEYAEGDDFHPAANVAKMSAGTPLDDADRAPWLDAIADWLVARRGRGGVVTCSALKRRYRDRLRAAAPDLFLVYLDVPRAELERRLTVRTGHFMKVQLLESQLAALEPPTPDEPGITVDGTAGVDAVVEQVRAALASQPE
ncbi:gluconokinase [Nocardia sp. CDC159]|uniref:Gluconokinase n=1 Tax=Nocardia pulmonis TaxID=2951408 RepID=A0A9X2E0W1_9NOCA|nr:MULTISPECIES: gluconokinase [Nocardia]MCM6772094.1 gluconokinase [Nocardia pulmonis]MCM6785248.1 gluconokinase [Nocardia sp. CDC159]